VTAVWERIDGASYFAKDSLGTYCPLYTDPVQGDLYNCSFVAGLISFVWTHRYDVHLTSKTFDQQTRTYTIPVDNTGQTVNDEILLVQSGGIPKGVRSSKGARTEIWPCIFEKAFAQRLGIAYDSMGWTNYNGCIVLSKLSGKTIAAGAPFRTSQYTGRQIYDKIFGVSYLSGKTWYPTVAWTKPDQNNLCHTCSVLGVLRNRNPLDPYCIIIRDPASNTYTNCVTSWNGITMGTNGMYALHPDTFKNLFYEFGWVTYKGDDKVTWPTCP
jgi:hypothetical protein